MARSSIRYWCRDCGAESIKWQGQCPSCEGWNTLDEVEVQPEPPSEVGNSLRAPGFGTLAAPQPIGEVEVGSWHPQPTGVPEFDRVLGGGLVAGSVTVVGGEPGIGKSTLLLQVAASVARRGTRVLYLSGEESAPQVRQRAERLGTLPEELWLAAETSLPVAVAALDVVEPGLVILDSVQTLSHPGVSGVPGSVGQVREVTARLVAEAKRRPITVLLVGHVTKEGSLAGPRTLEHMVDTVLSFEGDRHHALRLLRASKHRFGPTDDLGVFAMGGSGLEGVDDPSALFLADRVPGLPGSAVVPVLDGHRPILVEVQALTATSPLPSPRRTAQGVDHGRLGLLLAVLQRRVGIPVHDHDVYASAVGGARVVEPGADLAIALAVTSAWADAPIPGGLVACGEIGLSGEIRRVAQVERRLAEAARLGFRRALVPPDTPVPAGIEAIEVSSLTQALEAAEVLAQVVTLPRAVSQSSQ
jgi:DNA repair protein RadA/Sms